MSQNTWTILEIFFGGNTIRGFVFLVIGLLLLAQVQNWNLPQYHQTVLDLLGVLYVGFFLGGIASAGKQ
jgi:hypothetical protein